MVYDISIGKSILKFNWLILKVCYKNAEDNVKYVSLHMTFTLCVIWTRKQSAPPNHHIDAYSLLSFHWIHWLKVLKVHHYIIKDSLKVFKILSYLLNTVRVPQPKKERVLIPTSLNSISKVHVGFMAFLNNRYGFETCIVNQKTR